MKITPPEGQQLMRFAVSKAVENGNRAIVLILLRSYSINLASGQLGTILVEKLHNAGAEEIEVKSYKN